MIIIFHELGHFLLAKRAGVTVTEFSLGMGPRLLSFQAGGTRYSWKLLPFGGSCMMLGEDEGDEGEGTFGSKSVWARMSIIVAGPLFNFLLAFLMALFIVGSIGYDAPILTGVAEGTPAADAGLQAGDRIIKMNGRHIRLWRQVQNYSMFHSGETVVFEYERDGKRAEVTVAPALINGSYRYGISGNVNATRQKTNALQTLEYSAYEVGYWIETTVSSLKLLVQGGVSINDMSGPVGVVDAIGETYEESRSDGALAESAECCNSSVSKPGCYESSANSGTGRRKTCISDCGGDSEKAHRAGAGGKDSLYRADAPSASDGFCDV